MRFKKHRGFSMRFNASSVKKSIRLSSQARVRVNSGKRVQTFCDSDAEIGGAALETLVLNELRALNQWKNWDYEIYYWRTHNQREVDFVLYGKRGLVAIEVKPTARVRSEDLEGLRLFGEDYPVAKRILVTGGKETRTEEGIEIIPAHVFLTQTERYL